MSYLILIYVVVCVGVYYSNKKVIDHYVSMILPEISEFNTFERKRLGVYLNNLIDNPPPGDIQTDAQNGICTYNPNHILYYKNVLKDTDTKTDLEKYSSVSTKYFKASTYTDSIEWFDIPTLVKTRHIHGKTIRQPYAVIVRLRSSVHFGKIPKVKELKGKIPFDSKISTVIWRGGPSGSGFNNFYESRYHKPSREDMLKLWCNTQVVDDIDVGLVSKWSFRNFTQYLKNEMTIEEMLKYKYLLSIEGNDVATNLKWAMASDSLVIMPKPCVESWFAESLLEPWVHYVPVKDDFTDLLEIKKWCDANPDICKSIIENANQYANEFVNEEREIKLCKYVMEKYFEYVNIRLKDK